MLGSLLLIAYINDTFNISKTTSLVTCANDSGLLITGTKTNSMIYSANEIPDSLYKWVKNNGFTMNPKKPKAVFFLLKNKPNKSITFTLCGEWHN